MPPQDWKKVLIERLTNARYVRDLGNPGRVSQILSEHVWRDQRDPTRPNDPNDLGIAANRHQTWLFQDLDYTKPPPDSNRPRASVQNNMPNSGGTPHPGTGGVPANDPTPEQIVKINMLIQLAKDLGLWYDRASHTDPPDPTIIYEDVYHVLRAKMQKECAHQLVISFWWLQVIFAEEFAFEKMPPQRLKEMLCEAGLPFWPEFCEDERDPAEAFGKFFEQMPKDWSAHVLERSGMKEISEKTASEFMLQHVLSFIKRTETDHEWW